jgi:hypothetical protein
MELLEQNKAASFLPEWRKIAEAAETPQPVAVST